MGKIIFFCYGCNSEIEGEESFIGSEITCPACDNQFIAQAPKPPILKVARIKQKFPAIVMVCNVILILLSVHFFLIGLNILGNNSKDATTALLSFALCILGVISFWAISLKSYSGFFGLIIYLCILSYLLIFIFFVAPGNSDSAINNNFHRNQQAYNDGIQVAVLVIKMVYSISFMILLAGLISFRLWLKKNQKGVFYNVNCAECQTKLVLPENILDYNISCSECDFEFRCEK